jgi:hypothetical protein
MTDLQTKTPGKRGRVLLINGVSVAVDETTREVTESQGLPDRGPAREIRAVAADSGPTPTILRSVAQTDSFGLCASLELLGFHGYCDDFGGCPHADAAIGVVLVLALVAEGASLASRQFRASRPAADCSVRVGRLDAPARCPATMSARSAPTATACAGPWIVASP